MTSFLWILASGILMSCVALLGSLMLLIEERTLQRWLLPLVAFSAGSLLGGAFFHMIPAAAGASGHHLDVAIWVIVGFTGFLALESFLHWHHCHRESAGCRDPVSYLVLLGDALHNFLGGLSVGGTFILDIRLGIMTWLAAVAHEIPQELGDFAVLLHCGWEKKRALLFNFASALAFLVGGIIAYAASTRIDVTFLVPLAAGNFIYIGASDLVPQVNRHRSGRTSLVHFAAFILGLAVLLGARVALD